MSEDHANIEVRTAHEEYMCAVMAEAYYIDGGTPDEFKAMMKKNPDLAVIYNKEPHIFKAGQIRKENAQSKGSIDIYF